MTGIEHLLRKRLVICVGCGGVGKTTTAAALAVGGAMVERRTAVITVDPARRLKDALGLDGLSIDPRAVQVDTTHFDALALDTKRTFDGLVQRFAGNREAADRILGNRLYQELSNELAGSAEYMAMEKLHELITARRYQLLIVDTPPSAHLRDLLTAPNRLVGLLASRAVRLLQAPASLLSGAESTAGRLALSGLLKALQRWTGFDLLNDLAEFVSGFEHMIEGFSTRAEEVTQLLHSPHTAFVLITTPEARTIETTIAFHHELAAGGYPVAGVIANRVIAFPRWRDDDPSLQRFEPALQAKLKRNYRDLHELSKRDRRALQHLHAETNLPLLAAVPAVSSAPTTMAGLTRFAELLVPGVEARSASAAKAAG